jgi:hypothetical protein
MKPFTTIAGLIFLVGAAIHAYRLFANHFAVSVAGHAIPLNWSWVLLLVGVVLGVGLLSEARR